jgi:Lon protease-like protein
LRFGFLVARADVGNAQRAQVVFFLGRFGAGGAAFLAAPFRSAPAHPQPDGNQHQKGSPRVKQRLSDNEADARRQCGEENEHEASHEDAAGGKNEGVVEKGIYAAW